MGLNLKLSIIVKDGMSSLSNYREMSGGGIFFLLVPIEWRKLFTGSQIIIVKNRTSFINRYNDHQSNPGKIHGGGPGGQGPKIS